MIIHTPGEIAHPLSRLDPQLGRLLFSIGLARPILAFVTGGVVGGSGGLFLFGCEAEIFRSGVVAFILGALGHGFFFEHDP